MLRRDGEVFLLGTAMAEFYSISHDRYGRGQQRATVRTGGQSKARSEQETVSGFKRENGRFP
jgi:hypothetical protein